MPPPTMTTRMPTVALISGGKDSFFSLLHSNANNFPIIALANLHPPLPNPTTTTNDHPEGGATPSDDLNSFMYQTVGYTVLPHYATILGLPLYRAPITGGSINQDLSYHHSSNPNNPIKEGENGSAVERDETEDLYELLLAVKTAHPELKAVSSGAILSSYQRTRVENVCARLGLISLAWLWQRRQERVLSEMEEMGLDAKIIKVASLGLDEGWLGRGVADYKTRKALEVVKKRWGGNVAGEGGEFETLVVGCRGWKGRVEWKKVETVKEEAGVAWVRFLETGVVEVDEEEEVRVPTKPPVLDGEFRRVLDGISKAGPTGNISDDMTNLSISPPQLFPHFIQSSSRNLYITNLSGPSGAIEAQTLTIFQTLQAILTQHSSTLQKITSTLLLLRSMASFATINKIYSSTFSSFPNPPSRVCIALGNAMPEGIDVLLSVVVDSSQPPNIRKALHVQSRSYWAPANVGPYSQAIAVEGVVSVAGMIGLLPETMSIWQDEGIKGETVLALQSLVRVGMEINIHGRKGWLGGVGYVTSSTSVAVMRDAWEGWFSQDGEAEDDNADETEEEEEVEPFFERTDGDVVAPCYASSATEGMVPPLLIVKVAELPIKANVEFACLGIDSALFEERRIAEEADADDDDESWEPLWRVKTTEDTMSRSVQFGYHYFTWGATEDRLEGLAGSLAGKLKDGFEAVAVTVYFAPKAWEMVGKVGEVFTDVGIEGVGFVPVEEVWWGNEALDGEKHILGFAARFRKIGSEA